MLKYILACAIGIGIAYCGAATEYISGIENEGAERRDTFRIGNQSGNVNGYTVPGAAITKLTIDFVQSGTVPSGAISSPFSALSFPDTLKHLYLRGDATSLDVLFNGVARNALPTPPDGCMIHFSLTDAPSVDPGWFQSRILETSNIYVEPQSENPLADSILVDLGNTNTLYLGSNTTLANTIAELSCKVARHPDILAADAATSARLIAGRNLILKSQVKDVSVGGAFDLRFDATSSIIDPDPDITEIGINGEGSSDGKILYVTYLGLDQSDLVYRVYGSGSKCLSKVIFGTALPKAL